MFSDFIMCSLASSELKKEEGAKALLKGVV